MDDRIKLLLENIHTLENRATGYHDYFRYSNEVSRKQSRLIAEGCATIRHLVNILEEVEK